MTWRCASTRSSAWRYPSPAPACRARRWIPGPPGATAPPTTSRPASSPACSARTSNSSRPAWTRRCGRPARNPELTPRPPGGSAHRERVNLKQERGCATIAGGAPSLFRSACCSYCPPAAAGRWRGRGCSVGADRLRLPRNQLLLEHLVGDLQCLVVLEVDHRLSLDRAVLAHRAGGYELEGAVLIGHGLPYRLTVDTDLDRLALAGAHALQRDGVREAGVRRPHVGGDAVLVDRHALRREPLERHVDELPAVAQRHHVLGDALAEGLLAYDQRAAVVLQRARHDLGGAGRVAVNQHHHGQVEAVRVGRGKPLRHPARPLEHDVAALQEFIGHQDPLIEEAAAVVAQVEDERGGALLLELLELLDELLVEAVIREGGDAHVTDVVRQQGRLDRDNLDLAAHDLEGDDVVLAGSLHLQPHRRALRPADEVGNIGGCHVGHVDAINREEDVAALHPGPGGGTVAVDGEHLDALAGLAVTHRQDRAYALERAGLVLGITAGRFRGLVVGVGVLEGLQHPVDGTAQQLLIVNVLQVVGLDRAVALQECPSGGGLQELFREIPGELGVDDNYGRSQGNQDKYK